VTAPLTIFLGAFLAFLVQPLAGNALLPAFGGTAAVWTVCLATFQALLVGGYCYAHVTGRLVTWRVGVRRMVLASHVVLLLAGAAWLCCFARRFGSWAERCAAMSIPSVGACLALIAIVAFPYVLLCANSSLVQVLSGGRYKLYGLSNLGSLVGLVAYPLCLELHFGMDEQWLLFGILVAVYAVLFAILVVTALRKPQVLADEPSSGAGVAVTVSQKSFRRWFALAFVSCFLLNAVSAHLCSDITPLPMLWVWLLALYLLSYVAAFTDRGAKLAPWAGVLVVPLGLVGICTCGAEGSRQFLRELLVGSGLLFLGGWIVHSRLYRSKPGRDGLTRFYLAIAVGGAVGGAVCSLAMPLVSKVIAEYPIAIALTLGVVAADVREVVSGRMPRACGVQAGWYWRVVAGVLAAVALVGVVTALNAGDGKVLVRYRNFYGLGYVVDRIVPVEGGASYGAHEFTCNGTVHGIQKAEGNWLGYFPTTYYVENAGGLPIVRHPRREAGRPMRVALCGMGIGALATYAKKGDFYRFYEINPDVVRLATDERLFTFVPKAEGVVDIVVDDARKALAREVGEPKYDVLVVDVFTGDSIPPHMATKEAFDLYLDRLGEEGVLAFHLSNWHLDLLPLVKSAAKAYGLELEAFRCLPTKYSYLSVWAFLSRERLPKLYDEVKHERIDFSTVADIPLMTDARHSLLPYIRKDLFREILKENKQ